MVIISEKISNTKSLHIGIYGNTPYGDYLMMKEEYKLLDEDIVKSSWWYIVKFNEDYLRSVKRKFGILTCTFCGKPNLIIGTRKLFNLATVDHFYPSSKGGDKFNTDNFVVACNKCNQKKKDFIVSTDVLKYVHLYGDKLELLNNYKKLYPIFVY